ncbi:MAG: 7-cyano-7-deazaguanine synthase QueC [Caulobacterales bacterium]
MTAPSPTAPPSPTARSALVLFSAGQDSATCLAWALTRYERVETIGFDYGQRHAIELVQRPVVLDGLRNFKAQWAARLGPDRVVDMLGFGSLAESALTADRLIEHKPGSLPSTFVPGRNLAFLTFAAAHAYLRNLDVLVAGMCETDFAGYPDCRRDTIDAMQSAIGLGLDRPMPIETPLMHLTKAQTWALAEHLGGTALVDLIQEHTHTCYNGVRDRRHPWGYGCGTCPACTLRAAGWSAFAQSASP